MTDNQILPGTSVIIMLRTCVSLINLFLGKSSHKFVKLSRPYLLIFIAAIYFHDSVSVFRYLM